ncbi:MAG: hypothetical protein BroJett011_08040 [Chloroflexota bacterium]|nr:MAG: hypothetical protein BroJett011_08040 [Chloroflexota bacterium]
MSCNRNSHKIGQIAKLTGIAVGTSAFAAVCITGAKKVQTWRKQRRENTRHRIEKEIQLKKEQEKLKYLEAKQTNRFYDRVRDQFTTEKYIVAGRYRLNDDDDELTTDTIELFDRGRALSLAMSAGYTPWKVEVHKGEDDQITYTMTNLATREKYSTSNEPYGRRCRDLSGTWFEDDREEANQPHEILEAYSNRVVVS